MLKRVAFASTLLSAALLLCPALAPAQQVYVSGGYYSDGHDGRNYNRPDGYRDGREFRGDRWRDEHSRERARWNEREWRQQERREARFERERFYGSPYRYGGAYGYGYRGGDRCDRW